MSKSIYRMSRHHQFQFSSLEHATHIIYTFCTEHRAQNTHGVCPNLSLSSTSRLTSYLDHTFDYLQLF